MYNYLNDIFTKRDVIVLKQIKFSFNRIVAFISALIAVFSAFIHGNGDHYRKNYIYLDAAYGIHERQVFDMYLPKSADGNTGLILFLHPGGWVAGDKEVYQNELEYWSSQGYAAAAMNYRFISRDDKISMKDEMKDISLALAKMKKLASRKGIDLENVLLTGDSAGAHLALLYGYAMVDEAPIEPVAVVSYCGPTKLWDETFINHNSFGNFNPDFIADLLSALTGVDFTADNIEPALPALKLYSPITHVNENTVPTVLAYGVVDDCVPYSTGAELDAELTKYGVKHDFVTYPNSGHGLNNDPDCDALARSYFVEYVQKYLP